MIPIVFSGKKRKVGDSWVVTIPSGISCLLDEGRIYAFTVDEKEEAGE